MTNDKLASQLRLAADLLETGHPWEYYNVHYNPQWVKDRPENSPLYRVANGFEIRPALATPPDGRHLHNPNNLTAEQVGVGYRLTAKGEEPHNSAERWCNVKQWEGRDVFAGLEYGNVDTYRLPLSIPWPEAKPDDPYAELKKAHSEGKVIQAHYVDGVWRDIEIPIDFLWGLHVNNYRIKPEFHLPPPPPGIKWHREDNWQEGDLPEGYRPLVLGEPICLDDEWKQIEGNSTTWAKRTKLFSDEINGADTKQHAHHRTRRPLAFTRFGKTWAWHRPGDPMPCEAEQMIYTLLAHEIVDGQIKCGKSPAKLLHWLADDECAIIGWRYAEVEKKIVPLSADDITPLTRFRVKMENERFTKWVTPNSINTSGVHLVTPGVNQTISWGELQREFERNESLAYGKWNPDAWEPCSKEVDA